MYIVFTKIGKRKLLGNPKYFRGPSTPASVRSGHHTNPIRLNMHGRPAPNTANFTTNRVG